jgi:hypothetical protein
VRTVSIFQKECNSHYDRSTVSIISCTSRSLKRCISFKEEGKVSAVSALSMWICSTFRYSSAAHIYTVKLTTGVSNSYRLFHRS